MRALLCDLKYLLCDHRSSLMTYVRKAKKVWVILMAMIRECSLSNEMVGIAFE